jgi:putative CocE/NonD family hydrolase
VADSRILVSDERVAMRDGVQLATDVVRSDDDVRHPVLLIRTPYSRPAIWQAHDPISAARRGWAVVLQDVRGRGQSEGTFRPFHQEVDDGFDTVAWCAEQPWSDGRVAMTGYSYNGATQWLAALARPPALRAISPSVIGVDFPDDFAYEGGAFQQGFLSAWAIGLAATDPDPDVAARGAELVPRWPDVLAGEAGRKEISDVLADYAEWVPRRDDYWRPVDVAEHLAELDLPVWRLAGWYDVFCEGTLAGYAGMADHARSPQRLIVGPWTHAGLFNPTTPEVDFGPDGTGLLLAAEVDGFLRAALDGAAPRDGVTVFVMGAQVWRELPSWPPPSSALQLHLTSDGALTPDSPAVGTVSWRHDPADPVPTRGGRTLQGGLPLSGPVDQRPNEARDDVLVWTSEVLEDDVTVIGTIAAELEVRSTAAAYDIVVKVCDVHPDGRSLNVVDGIQRTSAPPETVTQVVVRVGSTAMTFRPGHRIRVSIASSDYPRYDQLGAAEQTLVVGRSSISLPVVPTEMPAHA